MHHESTDREPAKTGSAMTLSSAEQLPEWWPNLTAEMNRLMRLLPPEGHTAEMIGQRAKAAGQYLAGRYRNRPEVQQALCHVIDRGLLEWTKFPPPAELVEKIDSWLGFESEAAERESWVARRLATERRLEGERRQRDYLLQQRLQTDEIFRARVDRARRIGLASILREVVKHSTAA